VAGSDEIKRTNEIKTAPAMLDGIDIAGLVITGDALLTQRGLADYVVGRRADYHFTVKGNQPTLEADIRELFARRGPPDHVEVSPADHGRVETRRIWCSTRLNDYLTFPHAAQVFLIEREVFTKKTRKHTMETAVGVTSCTPEKASPADVLRTNRGHWIIENGCHYILDHTWDEDRCRIRTGHGPENTSRLRRFAISLLKHRAQPGESIASMTRKLAARTRLVFDYLFMTLNSSGPVVSD
jgi:predicted transposase YbfD/YdcC